MDRTSAAGLARILQARPHHVGANLAMAVRQHRAGDLQAAVALYERALRSDPENAIGYLNLGLAYRQMSELQASADCLRFAVRFAPENLEARYQLGVSCARLNLFHEALGHHRRVLEKEPRHAGALSDTAVALMCLDRPDDSLAWHERALEAAPRWLGAHLNKGLLLVREHRLDEALDCYRSAAELAPGDPAVEFAISNVHFLRGDLERGYAMYEAHRQVFPHRIREQRWRGDRLEGRTLLLYAQHGLGDTFQFVRYVPFVAERFGGTVVLQVQTALLPLLRTMPGASRVVGLDRDPGAWDVQATLLELPAIVGAGASEIPVETPYLGADPGLVATWRERLAADRGFRVGIAWQGNPRQIDALHRSCLLAAFQPLADIPGVSLYSLQQDTGTEQLTSPTGGLVVRAFPDLDRENGAFTDTAALMESLDLIVSIDTSVAHLAGALGRPTWILLPYWVDWRWGIEGERSLWYPTSRLFRQPRPFDWSGVLARVARELGQLAPSPRQGGSAPRRV